MTFIYFCVWFLLRYLPIIRMHWNVSAHCASSCTPEIQWEPISTLLYRFQFSHTTLSDFSYLKIEKQKQIISKRARGQECWRSGNKSPIPMHRIKLIIIIIKACKTSYEFFGVHWSVCQTFNSLFLFSFGYGNDVWHSADFYRTKIKCHVLTAHNAYFVIYIREYVLNEYNSCSLVHITNLWKNS